MKILFIAPIFFDYEKIIKKSLELHYEKVIFKNEVPFNSSVKFYAVKRLSNFLAQKAIDNYNEELLGIIKDENIKQIFIIRGVGLNENFFKGIRLSKQKVKIYHYQWDSFSIVPNGKMIGGYADYNFSFDLKDTQINSRFKHLPLFFIGENPKAKAVPVNFTQDIDILFVGSYHSERHKVAAKVNSYCEMHGLSFRSHIYIPVYSYVRDRLTTKKINRKDVSFKKLSHDKYHELIVRSKVILDLPYASQNGSTMRTIESLSFGRKLVSTNKMLKNENFYSSDNVVIWNSNEELNIDRLLNTKFDHSKDSYLLSIEEWLHAIGIC